MYEMLKWKEKIKNKTTNIRCRICIYNVELVRTITERADVKTKRFHDKLKWIYVKMLSAGFSIRIRMKRENCFFFFF